MPAISHTMRQVHQAIQSTQTIQEAATALKKPTWRANPRIFVDFLSQLGSRYEELKSLPVDDATLKEKFPHYEEMQTKKRKKPSSIDMNKLRHLIESALYEKKMTEFDLAKELNVSHDSLRFCLLARGKTTLADLRLNPEKLDLIFNDPAAQSNAPTQDKTLSLADIHTAMQENIQLQIKVCELHTAALLGIRLSQFRRIFCSIVQSYHLTNVAGEPLTFAHLQDMTAQVAESHFSKYYTTAAPKNAIFKTKKFIETMTLNCVWLCLMEHGVMRSAAYFGMSNISILKKILETHGITLNEMAGLKLTEDQARDIFHPYFDVKLSEIPVNYFAALEIEQLMQDHAASLLHGLAQSARASASSSSPAFFKPVPTPMVTDAITCIEVSDDEFDDILEPPSAKKFRR